MMGVLDESCLSTAGVCARQPEVFLHTDCGLKDTKGSPCRGRARGDYWRGMPSERAKTGLSY